MTPDSPNSPREELEARLTALLLGELSAEEAAALRQAIGQDPELARLENQLKETIGLVREATVSSEEKTVEPSAPLQLSSERREKLLASFKTTKLEIPKKPRRTLRLNRELLKLAAMVVALLLVGGVVVSYFTASIKMMEAVGEPDPGSVIAGVFAGESDSEQAKAYVVTVTGGSDPGRGRFKPSYGTTPGVSRPTPSTTLSAELATDAAHERAKAQILAQVRADPIEGGRAAADAFYRGGPTGAGFPPPPASGPAPAYKQLAQERNRFRSTIALPTSSEGQPSDELADVSGLAVTTSGATPVGRASSRADDFASVSVAGSGGRLLAEQLGEEAKAQSSSGLAGRQVEQGGPGGFRGNRDFDNWSERSGGAGGGLFGASATEAKESGRVPTPSDIPPPGALFHSSPSDSSRQSQQLADTKTAEPERAFTDLNRNGAVAAESFGFGNKELAANKPTTPTANAEWFGTTDLNVDGPAPAPAQRSMGRTPKPAEPVNGPTPTVAANPVPAAAPAKGLALASGVTDGTTANAYSADGGVEVTRRRVAPLFTAPPAQPVPSAAKQTPPGSYELALTSEDVGGLRFFNDQGQLAATPPPVEGLPAASSKAGKDSSRLAFGDAGFQGTGRPGEVVQPVPSPAKQAPTPVLAFDTSPALPRANAAMAGEKVGDLAVVVESEAPQLLAGRETVGRTPARPIRPATKPAETPAPTQKPDATKSTSFADDMDMVLTKPENTVVLAITTPAPAAPTMPAPATEPTREAKTKSIEYVELFNSAQKNEQDTWIGVTNAAAPFTNVTASYLVTKTLDDGFAIGGQQLAGTSIGGVPIADPNLGAGGGREWGIRQKLDADGDNAARFYRLRDRERDLTQMETKRSVEADPIADLAQPQPEKAALAQVQDKLGKADRGDANRTGWSFGRAPNSPPTEDEQKKKENKDAGSQSTITVNRVNGSDGRVLVEYEARTNGITVGAEFTASNDSKPVSEDSISRRSRVDIALPPGGENVRLAEREPRMQTGPVVINEVMSNPPEKQTGKFAGRLNQSLDRAASGAGEFPVRSIPTRPLRAQSTTTPDDPAAQYLNMAIQKQQMESKGRPMPALPSIPGLEPTSQQSAGESMPRSAEGLDKAPGSAARRHLSEKLNSIRLKELRFDSMPLDQVLQEINRQVRQADPNKKGVNLIVSTTSDPAAAATPAIKPATGLPINIDTNGTSDASATTIRIDPPIEDVTLGQALDIITKVADRPIKFSIEDYGILFSQADPRDGKAENLSERHYRVDLKAFQQLQGVVGLDFGGAGRGGQAGGGMRPTSGNSNTNLPLSELARVYFQVAGVSLPTNRSGRLPAISFDERAGVLTVRAPEQDLKIVDQAVEILAVAKEKAVAPPAVTNAPIPQPEIQSAENLFSTFSLNVSDVSFKLAAASLEKGQMPDPATVRSEEFINAFDYRDPEPKGSAPIAFAWERARYPFAHNRDLLRFSVKTAASGRQPGRPLNLVLLLDNSGSMERADRVRVIRECIRVLTAQLQPQDRVSVVAFARTAKLVVNGLTGTNLAKLPQEIGQLAPDGGTNLEEAMNLAYQKALEHFQPNGVNRVVLLTDGAANLGDVEPESLKKKVESHRKQGVALDCFGIGWDGYNDDLLEVLSRNGDGRYGFVNTPEAAATEFAGQLAGALRVAASDVKVQVEFNPRRVTAWRQIGYAKHQLKKEQFRDNTVDAAEIGAAEQGNALYAVQVNPNGEGPLGVVRVRFKVPGTSDYREHEWALPYSGAATPLEQSSPALRLAASASAFSEWLVSSPFADEVTPDRLLGYLSGVPETCAADPRPKKLEWMIRQAKSLSGK